MNCRIEIEVEFYEKEGGIVTKVESLVISAKDAPLKEVFMEIPSLSKVSCMHALLVSLLYGITFTLKGELHACIVSVPAAACML